MTCLFLLSGCTAPDPGGGSAESQGVTISARVDEGRLLPIRRQWTLGHGEEQLFRVRGAALMSGDRVAVLDAGNHRVLVLSPGGEPEASFGNEGEGPGEFLSAQAISIARDTVAVQDRANRLHFFTADGASISTFQVRFPDDDVRSLGAVVGTEQGWVASVSGYFQGQGTEHPPVLRNHFYLVNPADGSLAQLPLSRRHDIAGRFEGVFWLQPILYYTPRGDLDGLGRFVTADTSSYRIDVFTLDGAHAYRAEYEVDRQPIDGRLIDMWREARRCGPDASSECSNDRNDIVQSMKPEDLRPIVSRIRAFPSGHHGVLRADLDPNPFSGPGTRSYDYFDPNGTYLGRSTGLTPLWFDGRRLLALERDAMGVESVALFLVEA